MQESTGEFKGGTSRRGYRGLTDWGKGREVREGRREEREEETEGSEEGGRVKGKKRL